MIKLSRRRALQASLVSTVAALPVSSALAQVAGGTQDAWQSIASDPRFSKFVQLLEFGGLVQYFKTDVFTGFVPTDTAFSKDPSVFASLIPRKGRAFPDTAPVTNFMRSHALFDIHPLSEFSGKHATVTAISGSKIEITGMQPGVYVVKWLSVKSEYATANVVDKPIVSSNALLYPVDSVVLTAS
jgi:uncharacterized surface protein with fasciclin (FAS1) repeats